MDIRIVLCNRYASPNVPCEVVIIVIVDVGKADEKHLGSSKFRCLYYQ